MRFGHWAISHGNPNEDATRSLSSRPAAGRESLMDLHGADRSGELRPSGTHYLTNRARGSICFSLRSSIDRPRPRIA